MGAGERRVCGCVCGSAAAPVILRRVGGAAELKLRRFLHAQIRARFEALVDIGEARVRQRGFLPQLSPFGHVALGETAWCTSAEILHLGCK